MVAEQRRQAAALPAPPEARSCARFSARSELLAQPGRGAVAFWGICGSARCVAAVVGVGHRWHCWRLFEDAAARCGTAMPLVCSPMRARSPAHAAPAAVEMTRLLAQMRRNRERRRLRLPALLYN